MRHSTTATIAMLGLAAIGCRTAPPPQSSRLDLKGMDRSVTPGDDFNAFANGGWLKATPIPDDKASYGAGSIVADLTRKQVRAIIEDSAKNTAQSSPEMRKIGDYFSSYMDEAAIEAKGAAPLKPRLEAVSAIATKQDLTKALGAQMRADVDALNSTNFETPHLLGVWITQGLQDPSHTYPYLLQGGLGMPDRDYYISTTPAMAELRKKYQAHVATMLKLAGVSDPDARAARVFALETKIAQVHATRVDSANVQNAVTWKRAELAAKAPGLDWTLLLDAASLPEPAEFIIWHPKAVTGLAALVGKEPLESWKDWMTYHAIEDASPYLSKAFVEERFAFFGKALNGIPALRERWQRGVDFTSGALGEVVGKVYVERHFPPAAKAKVQAMVQDLNKAFGKRVDALTWMSPETKAKARKKLETLKVGVGYPDQWTDYSTLDIVKGDPLGNAERAELFEYKRQLRKLKQPIDRGEWWMTAQTVNAVNLPLQNALNFPAAILQPPYFDAQADAAFNYGAIGAVIGHEISHSFDDQGSQFDAEGRLLNWWTKSDLEHFQAAGTALAAQYDAYRPFPDLALNGKQTLSENIADVAGLLTAYDAYRLSLGGKEDEVKDGMTGDQRFFLSFAQSWRDKIRDAALRNQIATDGHAPDQYRVATVRNLDAWYEAYQVKPGQKLFLAPGQRVKVW